jgi:polysaccharide deacetylase family protein (PEP-CTERM system associated)
MASEIVNVLTVDLEDYYMVSAFESVVKREEWDKYESRIEINTRRLLDILNGSIHNPQSAIRNPIQATFFCLGWVAEHYPQLIKEIEHQGHEIACHSYDHQLVYNLNPEQFRRDVRTSKRILEDIAGKEVIGYRAPSYSITEKSLWALGILAEEGYRYDSSIFPIHHDRYGIPTAPRFPFLVDLEDGRHYSKMIPPALSDMNIRDSPPVGSNGNLFVEYPISTVKLLGSNAPISGGGYMRLLPYGVIKRGLEKINNVEKKPFVFYLHPWELDPDQPRFNALPVLSRFRHYINLGGTVEKLKRLLSEFSFSSMRRGIGIK